LTQSSYQQHQRKEHYGVIEDDSSLKQYEGDFNLR